MDTISGCIFWRLGQDDSSLTSHSRQTDQYRLDYLGARRVTPLLTQFGSAKFGIFFMLSSFFFFFFSPVDSRAGQISKRRRAWRDDGITRTQGRYALAVWQGMNWIVMSGQGGTFLQKARRPRTSPFAKKQRDTTQILAVNRFDTVYTLIIQGLGKNMKALIQPLYRAYLKSHSIMYLACTNCALTGTILADPFLFSVTENYADVPEQNALKWLPARN